MRLPATAARLLLAGAVLSGMLWAHARNVGGSNFYGYDEWTVLSLVSRGVIDVPYANRPLALLWALPAPVFGPDSFEPFVALRFAYLWLAALLLFWITLRLAPARPRLAFLACVAFLVWAPSDYARLAVTEGLLYSGITLGMLLSMGVFVESWQRRNRALLAVSSLLALVSGRCYEATLLVLALCPLLLLATQSGRCRAFAGWALAYEAWVLLGLALAAAPMLVRTAGSAYQASYGLDVQPGAILGRLAEQYSLHFGPLFRPSLPELQESAGPVAVAVAVFLAAAAAWFPAPAPAAGERGDLRLLVVLALLLTGAGYAVQLVTGRVPGAWRAQFLSAPGAAWLLAAVALAAGERLRRVGGLVTIGAFAWLVAVGTARTGAMQQRWEGGSFYTRQNGMLSDLVRHVPDTQPGTLIVLLDEGGAWRASFSFHHAVEYLYRGRAVGLVPGAAPAMLPAFFTPEGVVSQPIEAVRRPWSTPARTFRHDEIVVVRHARDGRSHVLDEWPAELPPLPTSAVYSPRSRLLAASGTIPQRRALWSLGAGPTPGPA